MKKQELINDVLKGLLVAAMFAAAMPDLAFADGGASDLNQAVLNSQDKVMNPAMQTLGYICYGVGAFFVAYAMTALHKHGQNPSQNPLGPAVTKLGVGGGLIAVPGIVSVIGGSGTGVFGSTAATVATFKPF